MGQFALFTYLRPFLESVTHVGDFTLSLLLLAMGVAGLISTVALGAVVQHGLYRTLWIAPVLMAEQLDGQGGQLLRRKIESMGVQVHTSKSTSEILMHGGEQAKHRLAFADGSQLEVDVVVFSTPSTLPI